MISTLLEEDKEGFFVLRYGIKLFGFFLCFWVRSYRYSQDVDAAMVFYGIPFFFERRRFYFAFKNPGKAKVITIKSFFRIINFQKGFALEKQSVGYVFWRKKYNEALSRIDGLKTYLGPRRECLVM